jgi:hypothetical protein
VLCTEIPLSTTTFSIAAAYVVAALALMYCSCEICSIGSVTEISERVICYEVYVYVHMCIVYSVKCGYDDLPLWMPPQSDWPCTAH